MSSISNEVLLNGPTPTANPGGQWFKVVRTAVERDCCAGIFCTICCCDGSIILTMCCPLSEEFVYKDPKTEDLFNEKGHILPRDTKTVALKPKELDAIKEKYGSHRGLEEEAMDRD